jgi:glycosyltransferase involved in cell wall biosynthesis
MKQPHIAMLTELPVNAGGAETFAHRLSQTLIAQGHAVAIYSSDTFLPAAPAYNGVPLVVYHYPKQLPRGVRGIAFLWNMARALWLHRHHYDVIHAHQARINAMIAVLVGKLARKPVVVTLTIGGPLGEVQSMTRTAASPLLRIVQPLAWRVILQADHFIGKSREIMDELRTQPLREAQLHLIFNGVPEMPTATSRPNPLAPMQVIAIGRLNPQKRFDLLIRALAQCPDMHVTIVGEGAEKPMLEALAAELGITERLCLLGYVKDAARTLLPQADAFVLCSDSEGMPNVLLEAMACGLPCITTPSGGATDIVTDDETALLIPFEDVDALATALTRLQNDAQLRQHLSAQARAHVRAHFSMAAAAQKHQQVYALARGK